MPTRWTSSTNIIIKNSREETLEERTKKKNVTPIQRVKRPRKKVQSYIIYKSRNRAHSSSRYKNRANPEKDTDWKKKKKKFFPLSLLRQPRISNALMADSCAA